MHIFFLKRSTLVNYLSDGVYRMINFIITQQALKHWFPGQPVKVMLLTAIVSSHAPYLHISDR